MSEWTDRTWNPISGCTKVSPGCKNCYAESMARRLQAMGQPRYRDGFAVTLHPEALEEPLRWRQPQRVFLCSMGDLFHEQVPDAYIAAVFGVMAACQRHTFQVLTKRPERMREWFLWVADKSGRIAWHHPAPLSALCDALHQYSGWSMCTQLLPQTDVWPLPNVWLGVTAENQEQAPLRIPPLLATPAWVRFVSVEPMMGPVDLAGQGHGPLFVTDLPTFGRTGMRWVIVGCESGPKRRPCKIEWVRRLVCQCRAAGTACLVKQLDIGGRVSHYPAEWPEDLRVREFPEEEAK